MEFVLYSEKTVAACMSALTDRLQGSSGKHKLDGWIEKSGKFALSLESSVMPRISDKLTRRTELRARIEKENGQTVIRGSVPDGVTPIARAWIYAALILLGIMMILADQLMIALALIPVGIVLYFPTKGDYVNSDLLIGEVQRTLKAKFTPINAASASAASKSTPAGRSTASAAKTAARPAARSTTGSRTTTPGKSTGRAASDGKPAARSTARPVSKANPATRTLFEER